MCSEMHIYADSRLQGDIHVVLFILYWMAADEVRFAHVVGASTSFLDMGM